MKKILINNISMCLVIVLLIVSLSSCQYLSFLPGNENINGNHNDWTFYPEGYTGGFSHQPGCDVEYWWVETYEECVAAIELLKSHDSTFAESVIFTYEGDLFDTKYCFEIPHYVILTEEIEFGENPFDRRGGGILVCSYAFFDDVTIEEINYSYVSRYRYYLPLVSGTREINVPDLTTIQLSYELVSYQDKYRFDGWYSVGENKQHFRLGSYGYGEDQEKAIKCVEAVCDSVVLLGFE